VLDHLLSDYIDDIAPLPVVLNGLPTVNGIIVDYEPSLGSCDGDIEELHFDAKHAKLPVNLISVLLDL